MVNNFYNEEELQLLNFKAIGENVKISKKCSIYNADKMTIGNNVRIDDFCILSGEINIGNYVHISAFNALYGRFGIRIGNPRGISPRSSIFSATDDFSGNYMISPMVPEKYCNIEKGEVIINDYAQIGANSIVMPGVIVGTGCATGAFSFINCSLEEWKIYVGIPVKMIKERNKNIIKLSKNLMRE